MGWLKLRISWRNFLHLPYIEKQLLGKVTILLILIWLGLRLLSFHTLYSLLIRWGRNPSGPVNNDHTYQDQVISAIHKVKRYLLGDNSCLTQALGGHFLLSRHGYQTHLRIGVQIDDKGKLHAHAWVESDGAVIIGGPVSELEYYTPLPELDGVRL